ncbi:CehA/McbA family metallohydrolase [Streptomyces triticirhizae]|uniref:CehA/McbA family metallohydrolase n=1 Tax=Streptomyces triticirhizae TaxID=2483353 RepID=UPI0018F41B35|nr:CehA/McbA family metallohydrolase [Streptomyces triticirhizae]
MTGQDDTPPPRAAGRGPGWYRGDCHVHSTHSDGGELTLGELAAEARRLGLDFLATTEHASTATHGAWGRHAGDDLLVILGEEVTTRDGHWLALGLRPHQTIDARYGAGDAAHDRHLAEVHEAGGLCVAAHPHAPYPTGTLRHPYRGFDAVEVWNGQWASDLPWNADNEAALADWARALAADVPRGRWRPAIGDSDVHLRGQLGTPATVVYADELGVDAVLAGLRAGRCWIAESAAVGLTFTARAGDAEAGVGERLATRGRVAVARAEVHGVPSGTVGLHTEAGPVHHAALPAEGSGAVEWAADARRPGAFVRVEVRHADGRMAALSNPIVLD